MTSLDGLTGGPPGASGDDGGAIAADGAARVDGPIASSSGGGSSSGGSSGGDASLGGDDAPSGDDASDAGIADAPTGWCTTHAAGVLYCVDFDDGATIDSYFDSLSHQNGSATLNTGNPRSAPNVMLVQTSSGASPIDVAGYKAFPSLTLASGMVLTASADVRVAQADESRNSDAIPFEIELYDSFGDDWELEFELLWNQSAGAFDVYLTENGDLPDGGNPWHTWGPPSTKFPLDAWKRVTIEVTLGPGGVPLTGRMLIDGTQILSATLHPVTVQATAEVITGTPWVYGGNGAWNIRYDDVTFNAQ